MIIKSPSTRSSWKLGKIEKLLVGKDGAVRAAQVHQAGGQVLNRPLQHLYPLEIQDERLISGAANHPMLQRSDDRHEMHHVKRRKEFEHLLTKLLVGRMCNNTYDTYQRNPS